MTILSSLNIHMIRKIQIRLFKEMLGQHISIGSYGLYTHEYVDIESSG